jgi:acyl-CoA dehydrogenase
MDELLTNQFDRLITGLCPLDAARRIEAGERQFDWDPLEASGFLDLLLPAESGGAALDLADCAPLAIILGRKAVPAPVLETMVARAEQVRAGRVPDAGPIRLSELGSEPRLRRLGALCVAGQMAGAMAAIRDLTLSYAKERSQFGRPISAFQAVQQQIAVLAEEAAVAEAAVALAFSQPLASVTDEVVAVAKITAGEAAATVAAIAHAVHGAIGVSGEHALHLFTGRLHAWRLEYGSAAYWSGRLGAAFLGRALSPLDFARSLF